LAFLPNTRNDAFFLIHFQLLTQKSGAAKAQIDLENKIKVQFTSDLSNGSALTVT
jgi:hypothetical protein